MALRSNNDVVTSFFGEKNLFPTKLTVTSPPKHSDAI